MRRASLAVVVSVVLLAGSIAGNVPFHRSASANTGFKLPWTAGESYLVTQGWGGTFSHVCPGPNCHAYDFGLPEGTALRASAAGTVVAAVGSYSTGGCSPSFSGQTNYVRIAHGDGSLTVYLHLSDVAVSVDQVVSQGELIGHSGETGYACGPHLHFQRNMGGGSVEVYFDEYKDQQLTLGQRVTSQNTAPAASTATPTHTPTATLTPTATPTPTSTPTPTPTATPTPTGVAGDVDCDTAPTSRDAVLILQYDARLIAEVPCPGPHADVNVDGRTDTVDALLVLQWVAGLVPALPVRPG